MFSFESSQKYPSYEPRKSSTDADQLLLRLSVFSFSKLSVSDQHEHIDEIRKKVAENVTVQQLSEESDEAFRMRTYTELLKKLPFTFKNHFLFKVVKKFKHERQFAEIISSFKQLDASDQQKLIESIIHDTPEKILQTHEEADEGFRLRRITQLSRDYTDHVYKCLVDGKYIISGNHDILLAELQSRYADFFFGFSTIWFQGQTTDAQRRMIKQLDGDDVLGKRLRDESEEDFNLRSFTELFCKKAVDFRPQVYFLDAVEERLLQQEKGLPHGRLLPPQDFDSAAELLSSLSTFGFSLLPEKDQLHEIEEMCEEVGFGHHVNNQRQHQTETSEEDSRIRRFKELYDHLWVDNRIEFLEQLTKKFFRERQLCESILLFRRLGSPEQTETIQNLFDGIMKSRPSWRRLDVIVEKLTEESDEDFRLSRFKTMYMAESSYVWNWFCQVEARKLGPKATLQLHAFDNKEIPELQQAQFAELFMGLVLIWFKARCAHHPRNPVHVILSGEFFEVEDASEKLAEESEEDFRLRRFTEAFEQLEFDSRERIVKYIKLTLFHDLGYKPIEHDTMFRILMERDGKEWA